MYIYESHTGGYYALDEYEDTERCEQCGDSDWYVGYAKTRYEALRLLMDSYTLEFIDETFSE